MQGGGWAPVDAACRLVDLAGQAVRGIDCNGICQSGTIKPERIHEFRSKQFASMRNGEEVSKEKGGGEAHESSMTSQPRRGKRDNYRFPQAITLREG